MISSAELRHEMREDLKAQRERIAELEKALHEINRWNDHPARYSEPLQRILNDVIDTSDIKFKTVK